LFLSRSACAIRYPIHALNRKWKDRRVVYTEKVLGLAHANGEKLLDVIPLTDIVSIQDCDGIGAADADDGAGRVLLEITLTVLFYWPLFLCAPESFGQDRNADGVMSKIFSSTGNESSADEKGSLQEIFRTIDTDGTGSCSIDELSVSNLDINLGQNKFRLTKILTRISVSRRKMPEGPFINLIFAGLPEETFLHPA
jgi:hypothetical protein